MAKHETVTAVILKTHDVGEADRFCIILTKELGTIHARANGVRKLHSALGPMILPLQYVRLELYTRKESSTIQKAELLSIPLFTNPALHLRLQPLLEICLILLPESVSVPAVFTVFEHVFAMPTVEPHTVVAGLLHILYILGYVPNTEHESIQAACTKEELEYIAMCCSEHWHTALQPHTILHNRLKQWVQNIVHRESNRHLKSLALLA